VAKKSPSTKNKTGPDKAGVKRGKKPATGKRVGKSVVRPPASKGRSGTGGKTYPAGKRSSPGGSQAGKEGKAGKNNAKGRRGSGR
jgi:hypothetical protein